MDQIPARTEFMYDLSNYAQYGKGKRHVESAGFHMAFTKIFTRT